MKNYKQKYLFKNDNFVIMKTTWHIYFKKYLTIFSLLSYNTNNQMFHWFSIDFKQNYITHGLVYI